MRLSAWITVYRVSASLFLLLALAAYSTAQEPTAPEEPKDGTAKLEEAFSLKITAQSTRDLDNVADLLEDALELGLDEEGIESANQLLSSTLYEHAELLSKQIFDSAGRIKSWRAYRAQAITRLERSVELNPKMGQAYQLMARLHGLPAGDREAGLEAIEKAIELAGDDQEQLSRALVIRAQLAEDDQSMLADLAQAIKIDPKNLEAIQVRGQYYLRNNEFEKAVEDFKTWLASDEKNVEAYHEVARTLAALEKYKEAIEIMDDAVKLDGDSTKSLLLRAQLNLLGKTYDAAVEDATQALKLDRKLFTARLIRAQALLDQGEYNDALEDVEQVLEEEPNVLAGINLRFEINLRQGKYGEAIKDLKYLADLAPTSLGFQLQLAQLYTADDQPRRAIRIYNRVLSDIEGNTEEADELRKLIFRGRGDARLALGQHKEAIEDYNEAMEIDPDDDGILNNLAWVLATSPVDELRDGKKAIEFATKACEVTDYKRPHILSTLASGFAEEGDFEKAREWIEKAIKVNEADAEADKDGDQTVYQEQLESLKKELASYEKEQPWRELQNVEEERAKRLQGDDAESDDEEADEDDEAEGADDKKSDDKAGEDKKPDSSEEKKKDDGDGDGGDASCLL